MRKPREIIATLICAAFGSGLRFTYVTTPLIAVERKEIHAVGRVATTRQIVLQHRTKLGDVGGRVSDWNGAVALRITVGLQVASGSLDTRQGFFVSIFILTNASAPSSKEIIPRARASLGVLLGKPNYVRDEAQGLSAGKRTCIL